MDRDGIVCIFCGGRAAIKEKDNLKIISCPKCKRETDLDTYNEMCVPWEGLVRYCAVKVNDEQNFCYYSSP